LEEALGRRSFVALYFTSGVIGGLLQALGGVLLGGALAQRVVGASAGAFGLVAARFGGCPLAEHGVHKHPHAHGMADRVRVLQLVVDLQGILAARCRVGYEGDRLGLDSRRSKGDEAGRSGRRPGPRI
jgi:hypothetical protein